MKPIPDLIPVIRNQQSERISKVYQVGGSKRADMNANIFYIAPGKIELLKKTMIQRKKSEKITKSTSCELERRVHVNTKCHLHKCYLVQPVRLLTGWVRGHR